MLAMYYNRDFNNSETKTCTPVQCLREKIPVHFIYQITNTTTIKRREYSISCYPERTAIINMRYDRKDVATRKTDCVKTAERNSEAN